MSMILFLCQCPCWRPQYRSLIVFVLVSTILLPNHFHARVHNIVFVLVSTISQPDCFCAFDFFFSQRAKQNSTAALLTDHFSRCKQRIDNPRHCGELKRLFVPTCQIYCSADQGAARQSKETKEWIRRPRDDRKWSSCAVVLMLVYHSSITCWCILLRCSLWHHFCIGLLNMWGLSDPSDIPLSLAYSRPFKTLVHCYHLIR